MRRILPLLFLAAICAAAPAAAQDSGATPTREELAELCKTVLCREPGTFRLTLDDGRQLETRFDAPRPIVIGGERVTIYPGEMIFIEADVSGDRLVNLRAVEAIADPARTIELKMWRKEGEPYTYLAVTNPFPRILKFHFLMMLPTGDDLHETSSCPVVGNGGSAYESWPHAILQLVLIEPRLLDEDAENLGCVF